MSLFIAAETIGSTEFGIRIASEAESDMTSVERVFTYAEIDPEPAYNSETLPPEDWPTEGSLTLHDLSLAYLKGAPATLNNISVCIAAKEKVGVAGRTGAGKSSLVAALFRMPEPEGKVRNVIIVIFENLILPLHNRDNAVMEHSFPTNMAMVRILEFKTDVASVFFLVLVLTPRVQSFSPVCPFFLLRAKN